MRSFATLLAATLLSLSAFVALGRASSQFRYDLVAVATPAAPSEPPTITPLPDAGIELAAR